MVLLPVPVPVPALVILQVIVLLVALVLLEVFVVISEMNVQRKIQQNEYGVDLPEVAMDLMLSAYGRQRTALLQPKVNNN